MKTTVETDTGILYFSIIVYIKVKGRRESMQEQEKTKVK